MSELAALKSTVEKQGSVIDALAHRLGVAEDTLAIQALHNTYGYCTPLFLAPPCLLTTEEEYSADLDKCLYLQVVDLFEDDGEVRFHGAVFKGKAGVKRLFVDRFGGRFVGGKNGPITGYLLDHLLLQHVVHVAPDRLSAKMRARTFMQAGRSRDFPIDPANNPSVPRQWWEGGIYENEYGRKSVDDPWQIRLLNYHPTYHGDFSLGWALTQPGYVPFMTMLYPQDPLGPDELLPFGPGANGAWIWPDTHTIPFHYKHPITNEDVRDEDLEAVTLQEYRAKKVAGAVNGQ